MAASLFWVYAIVVLMILWFFVHLSLIPKPIPGIPYKRFSHLQPWGDLGSLGIHAGLGFGGEVFDWFSSQCLELKAPLVQVFMPTMSTTHPVLILSDLREIEDIVTRRTSEVDRAEMMHTWFGLLAPTASIGLNSKHEGFRQQRRLWSAMLSPIFLMNVVSKNMYAVANEVAELWKEKARQSNGSAFDATEDLQMVLLEATWRNLFGSKLDLLASKYNALGQSRHRDHIKSCAVATFDSADLPEFWKVFQTLLMCLDWVLQGVTPRGYAWFFRCTGILTRAERKKNNILDQQVDAIRVRVSSRNQGENPSAIDALSAVLEKNARIHGSPSITGVALRDEALELLITGQSTSSSFSWVLKYLAEHQTYQNKLRNELLSSFGHATPTVEEMMTVSLPYLDSVIAETLRCSATGPICFRQTTSNCTILGHDVPAGTPLLLVTAGPSYKSSKMPHVPEHIRSVTSQKSYAHRMNMQPAANFQEQQDIACLDTFDPGRWIVGDHFNPEAVRVLPFSAGARGCFGKRIAMVDMRILITVLIATFTFPKMDDRLSSFKPVDGLSRRPRQCYVKPRPLSE